jgi:hypothetical protein
LKAKIQLTEFAAQKISIRQLAQIFKVEKISVILKQKITLKKLWEFGEETEFLQKRLNQNQ